VDELQPAVEVKGVEKRFGAVRALAGVSLKVRQGEVYGLLGPNGSGKTTLIRALVGLVAPDRGEIWVLGRRMPDIAVLGKVGYMTQQAALYPDLSVKENVEFFAALYNAGKNVQEALEVVRLGERAGSVVATLSSGMRQRVSLACALVHRPELLLLDEPTVGIDPQLRVEFWDHFRRLTAAGTTIIVSSHVMDEAERADRLGLIRSGKLLAEGSVEQLKQRAGVERLEDAFLRLAAEPMGMLSS
jgi:ABC-2 type transport system ATP-binding protein